MKNRLLISMQIVICLGLMFDGAAAKQSGSQVIKSCVNSSQCNKFGMEALTKRDFLKARHYFWWQARYAEDEQDKKAMLLAYNNLADLHEKQREYSLALVWIYQARRIDGHDPSMLRELNMIQRKMKASKWPTAATGTYIRYAGKAYWDALCIGERSDGEASVFLYMILFTSNWRTGPATEDMLQGITHIQDGKAVFAGDSEKPKCTINMKFSSESIQLEQDGECSIDYRLSSTGIYHRISTQVCNKDSIPLPIDRYNGNVGAKNSLPVLH